MSAPDPAPVRSMTGFALVRRTTGAGELTLSLRSVNHRGLDLHFHQATELNIFENAMRSGLKAGLGRGHVEVRASIQRPQAAQTASYDREAIARFVAAFRQSADEHGLAGQPDLNVALSLPGIFEREREPENLNADLEPQVMAALQACITELNAHREREGAALVSEFVRETDAVEQAAREIQTIRASARAQFQQRLEERLRELLAQSNISEARLAEEAAILTDRSDIQEEVARLLIHTAELRRMLAAGGEIGKRLDFLLQEMNRETNTILSKTSGVGDTGLTITRHGLAIKAHIEKIREQALNIE